MTYTNHLDLTAAEPFLFNALVSTSDKQQNSRNANPPNNVKRYRSWCQFLSYTQIKHETRQNEILTAIRAFYERSGQIPNIKQTIEAAHCDYSTAKPALATFEQELQAELNKKDLLIYVNSVKVSSKTITTCLQQSLDNAAYALNQLCPKSSYLLTFVCPGNSELAYAAIARNSQSIANAILEKLSNMLPPDFMLYYLYAWENQTDRLAPHLHVLLNLPDGNAVIQQQLTSFWYDVLDDEIARKYNIDAFANDSEMPSYAQDNPHLLAHAVHIEPFYLQLNKDFESTYLAKKKSKEPRILAIAKSRAVAFDKWGGVSASLKPLAQALPLKEKIPAITRDEVDEIIDQTKSLMESVVPGVNWLDHSCQYNGKKNHLGYKARFNPKDFKQVKELLDQHAISLHNRPHAQPAHNAIHFVAFELRPSGHCYLKYSFSKTNYKNQQRYR